ASAVARLMPDGAIVVEAATHELGTGTYTVMTQIAAEALGVPIERLRFDLGDSAMPENPISAGSMTVGSTGPAVHATALALRDQIRAAGADPADLDACRGVVARAGGRSIEVRSAATPGPKQQQYSMHSFGA